MAVKHVDPEIVAAAFAGVLRGWLTVRQWRLMRRRNLELALNGDKDSCASHDFCDANMAMDAALQLLGVYSGALKDMNATTPLLNEAWGIAKPKYLTAKKL